MILSTDLQNFLFTIKASTDCLMTFCFLFRYKHFEWPSFMSLQNVFEWLTS